MVNVLSKFNEQIYALMPSSSEAAVYTFVFLFIAARRRDLEPGLDAREALT